MPLAAPRQAVKFDFEPGDILVLLSDGIYEYHDPDGEQFGEARVEELVRANHDKPMAELSKLLLDAVRAFARGAPQEDDITFVLVKREPLPSEHQLFERRIDSLDRIVGFTTGAFGGSGSIRGCSRRSTSRSRSSSPTWSSTAG
jgi:serine/threonine protein phosphatase PrpC